MSLLIDVLGRQQDADLSSCRPVRVQVAVSAPPSWRSGPASSRWVDEHSHWRAAPRCNYIRVTGKWNGRSYSVSISLADVQQLDSICQWKLSLVQIKLSFLSSAGIKELKINGYLALLLQWNHWVVLENSISCPYYTSTILIISHPVRVVRKSCKLFHRLFTISILMIASWQKFQYQRFALTWWDIFWRIYIANWTK